MGGLEPVTMSRKEADVARKRPLERGTRDDGAAGLALVAHGHSSLHLGRLVRLCWRARVDVCRELQGPRLATPDVELRVRAYDFATGLGVPAVQRGVTLAKADVDLSGVQFEVGAGHERTDQPRPTLCGGSRRVAHGPDLPAASQVDQASTDRNENQPTSHRGPTKPHRGGR